MSQASTFGFPRTGPATPIPAWPNLDDNLKALLSQHSGSSPPAYAVKAALWADTATSGFITLKIYDGADWIPLCTVDEDTNYVRWYENNPEFSVASASTVDLGSVASSNIIITGNTTITSFGTSAAGLQKNIRFSSSLQITNSTSIVTPSGSAIFTSSNDACVALSLGSGNWRIIKYTPAIQPGIPKLSIKTASYTVADSDNGATFKLGGSVPFSLTFNASATYNSQFQCRITNTDPVVGGAAKKIVFTSGRDSIRLYPGQSIVVTNIDGAFVADPYLERWQPRDQINLYVDSTNGSDDNDGLAAGTGRALQTIVEAVKRLYVEIDNGASMAGPIINLSAGVFTEDVQIYGALTGNIQILIVGAGQALTTLRPASSVALQARDNGIVTIKKVRLQSTTTGQKGLYATQKSVIDYADIDFGPFPGGIHIDIVDASVNCIDPPSANVTKITGNASYHVNIVGPGIWTMGGNTINIPQNLVFTSFLRMIGSGAMCNMSLNAFTGAGSGSGSTGYQYQVSYNATAFLSGTVLPGATAGVVSNGGQVA